MKAQKGDEYSEMVEASLMQTAGVLKSFPSYGAAKVVKAAKMIAASMEQGGKLLLCGNGGSAADCQHMAAEFVCRLSKKRERKALPAIALTTDTSFLTAFANDYCFEDVFARQVEALGRPGDVLLGISTSGESENVNRAIAKAGWLGLGTIALTRCGGRSGAIADAAVEVDSEDTAVIQNVHLAVEHILCAIVEDLLVGGGVAGSRE